MNFVESILQFVTQLPPFPAVLQRVLHMVEDPKTSAQDVVEVIQYDQAITANVLIVANSAYFGFRRPIHSIREALVKIGFNQLIEIILTQGSAHLFCQSCQGYNLTEGQLWRHSVACALLSKILSCRVKWESTPAQFTAALLHDVGKIILSPFVKNHFEDIENLVREQKRSFAEAEKEVLGIDHAELGGKISERWNFPADIIAGIRHHHTPFLTRESHELVATVYLGDITACMAGFGGSVGGLSYDGHKEVMKQYGLTKKDIEEIINQLESELKHIDLILSIK
jgi:putative nucleotidyltransferase with HDIG domain